VSARHAGGWAEHEGARHWWGADGRPACDPQDVPLDPAVDEELDRHPYDPLGGCVDCVDVVEALRARAAALGLRLDGRLRFPNKPESCPDLEALRKRLEAQIEARRGG
jgi:hypothetical protein